MTCIHLKKDSCRPFAGIDTCGIMVTSQCSGVDKCCPKYKEKKLDTEK